MRVRLSLIANPTPIDAEFLDEAELLDLGGGGGGEMEWGSLPLPANPTPKGGRISGVFFSGGGGGWQALSDNHLNTLVRPRLAA